MALCWASPISLARRISGFACTSKQFAAHPVPLLSLDFSKLTTIRLAAVIVVIRTKVPVFSGWNCSQMMIFTTVEFSLVT